MVNVVVIMVDSISSKCNKSNLFVQVETCSVVVILGMVVCLVCSSVFLLYLVVLFVPHFVVLAFHSIRHRSMATYLIVVLLLWL